MMMMMMMMINLDEDMKIQKYKQQSLKISYIKRAK